MADEKNASNQSGGSIEPDPIDIDIVIAVEMLIKSVVAMGQKIALMEIALADLQYALRQLEDQGVDDGK